jgi:2-polyprenyl-3-methyl-5-hydroxy-6-metoxy-1,4-benzoquinol methylase
MNYEPLTINFALMQMTWFKDWFNSPYYHQLYFNRDDKEAAAFIDKLINYLKPVPGSYMLDVACGKGRHSIQLASKGFDVTGIDLSDDSINEAYIKQVRFIFTSTTCVCLSG